MGKIVMIDADDTLYFIKNKEEAYKEMLLYVSKRVDRSYTEVKEMFWNIVNNKRTSSLPQDHDRKLPLKLLGLKEEEIREALNIFINKIKEGITPTPSIKDFLVFLLENDFSIIVFSDEFRPFLEIKLSAAFGDKYRKYFKEIITPETTGCMKPCVRYYTSIENKGFSLKDVAIVIGNDYKKDLEIPQSLSLPTALFNATEECEADFCFQDFKELIAFLS